MKKFLAMAIAVAAVLTGCVKNETFAPANEIQFKNFALSNKALVADGAFATTLTFGVEMYKAADNNLWDEGKVEYKDSSYWGFNPAKFWPTEAGTPVELNFFAYYPYGATVACDTDKGISITGADLGTTIGNQTDYLLAPVAGPYKVQAAAVGVAFQHISSLLLFSAQDITLIEDLKEKVTINSITVKGVSTSGDYANKEADAVAGTWTPDTAGNLPTITLNAPVKLAGAALTTTASNPVLVVPTALTEGTQVVDIVYSVAAYTYGGQNFDAKPNQTTTVNLKAGSIDKWEQGKKYVYTIKFNLTEELEIKFAPTVTDWTAGGSEDLTVDVQL